MSTTIIKTSVLPASAEVIWEKLQTLSSLRYVAAPFATFEPLDGSKHLIWKCGEIFKLNLRLFGIIPFGIHSIQIISLDQETLTICSKEHNPHIMIWNHRIRLEPIDGGHTRYTDWVEIDAGRKTSLVRIWARIFYAHRQRKWKKLLEYEIPT